MAIDNSAWDGPAAMSGCAKSDNPAAAFKAICAGRREGDPALEKTWALPHHKTPGAPPNADGVRNALSRLPQTQGLTNKAEAQSHLEAHMKAIQAAEAKSARKEALARGKNIAPVGGRTQNFAAQLRGAMALVDGRELFEVEGYATTFEMGYEMWDMFGPYTEIMDQYALDRSLASKPDVAFLVNHKGVTMARTTNNSLTLSKDTHGLHIRAYLNPERHDVHDLMLAMKDDGVIDEMSFAFMLEDGKWDEDYESFRITQANINRGDVSAVNYGANPFTSIQARATDWLRSMDEVPEVVARAAAIRLNSRFNLKDLINEDVTKVEQEPVKEEPVAEVTPEVTEVVRIEEPAIEEVLAKPGGKPIAIWEIILDQLKKN